MKKMDYCNFFLLYMKMSEKNYYQRNKKNTKQSKRLL